MKNLYITIAFLVAFLNAHASDLVAPPSKVFGAQGTLACTSRENCKLPSQKSLHKIAEEFLSYSQTRMKTLDKIEADIRSSISIYQIYSEEVFSKTGNTELKAFLESSQGQFENLLKKLGISDARYIIGGNSPFLKELKYLSDNLKQSEVNVFNANNKKQAKEITNENQEAYYSYRKSDAFKSYMDIDQVEKLINFYNRNGGLRPWLKNSKEVLNLKFSNCSNRLKKLILKTKPSINLEQNSKPMQFDIFEEDALVAGLVQKNRLLKVSCRHITIGLPEISLKASKASVIVKYRKSEAGDIILPSSLNKLEKR